MTALIIKNCCVICKECSQTFEEKKENWRQTKEVQCFTPH